jgi:hypothetical protein
MRLAVRREAFTHPDWIFEIKYDGFRSLACVAGGQAEMISRRRNVYKSFAGLCFRRSSRPIENHHYHDFGPGGFWSVRLLECCSDFPRDEGSQHRHALRVNGLHFSSSGLRFVSSS